MHKVVYNNCFGGFGLSRKAIKRYEKLSGKKVRYSTDIDRHDPFLVQAVEELGRKANTPLSDLQIAAIPGNRYSIEEYDGSEVVNVPSETRWTVIPDDTKSDT